MAALARARARRLPVAIAAGGGRPAAGTRRRQVGSGRRQVGTDRRRVPLAAPQRLPEGSPLGDTRGSPPPLPPSPVPSPRGYRGAPGSSPAARRALTGGCRLLQPALAGRLSAGRRRSAPLPCSLQRSPRKAKYV